MAGGHGVRVGSWAARGLRTPLRPAQASEVTTVDRMGRRLGVERSIDAVGAALGPVLALLFLTFLEVRTVILLAVLPAVAAVAVSARANRRRAAQPGGNPTRPDLDVLQPDAVWQLPSLRSRIDQLRRGRLGRFLLGVAIYETANIAAVLLLLRATKLLPAGAGPFSQLQLVALLYIGYQLSAAVCASWAGALADRIGTGPIIAGGATCLLTAYAGFALAGTNELLLLAVCFVLAGAAAGAVDAAEYTGVGRLGSPEIRWTAFGTLAALQSGGRAIATLTAGALWTFVAPEAGPLFCAPLLVVATILFTVRADRPPAPVTA
ncbi:MULTISPECIES: MFS transporter [unclassified Parafrankia]|uniref:MFS transporter n=1 Tax=unclassified Parafrankia TaxID=2994368 RepID=UPI000DA4F9BC